jgi:hypothetical protein
MESIATLIKRIEQIDNARRHAVEQRIYNLLKASDETKQADKQLVEHYASEYHRHISALLTAETSKLDSTGDVTGFTHRYIEWIRKGMSRVTIAYENAITAHPLWSKFTSIMAGAMHHQIISNYMKSKRTEPVPRSIIAHLKEILRTKCEVESQRVMQLVDAGDMDAIAAYRRGDSQ